MKTIIVKKSIYFFCMITSVSLGAEYRVSYNPYENVNWENDQHCLTQLHDHVNVYESKIRAYDEAGYNAIAILNYSGVQSLSYSWKERHWPLSNYLTEYSSDEEFLSTCNNLKILIPSAEEVGFRHITSPFLKTYIEKWEPEFSSDKQNWQYQSNQECIDLINENGGLPFMAHPWNSPSDYLEYNDLKGIEIFSGYALNNNPKEQSNFLNVWDKLLEEKSTTIWGISVNDWYGPFWNNCSSNSASCDSGKIVVLIKDWNLEEFQLSLTNGTFFSIADIGEIKGKYPIIHSIETKYSINIFSNNLVKWFSNGTMIFEGNELKLNNLPSGLKYIRAEISNEFGIVFLQPFTLKLSADFNEDGRIDVLDYDQFQLCSSGPEIPCSLNCSKMDLDLDGDVDQEDFGHFQKQGKK